MASAEVKALQKALSSLEGPLAKAVEKQSAARQVYNVATSEVRRIEAQVRRIKRALQYLMPPSELEVSDK